MVETRDKKPEIVVFAGPNGSGKSTFTELLRPPFDYINADEIKKNLKCDDMEAALIAQRQKEEHLERGANFCFETVLSTERNLDLLRRAKAKGYFIRCYYVLTVDPAINVLRIQSRILLGGHDVPKEKTIERYYKCLNLMKEVIEVSDICHVYDNSYLKPTRIFKKGKREQFYHESEIWSKEKILKYCLGTGDVASAKDLNKDGCLTCK